MRLGPATTNDELWPAHEASNAELRTSKRKAQKLENHGPEASGGSFLSSQRVVLSSPELCWTRWVLRGRSGGAPEASRGRSGEAWGALGELSGASGDAPGTPRERFWEVRRRPEAKTATCLKTMTLTALSLCFRGPEGSEMRPECTPNGRKRAASKTYDK